MKRECLARIKADMERIKAIDAANEALEFALLLSENSPDTQAFWERLAKLVLAKLPPKPVIEDDRMTDAGVA